MADENESFLDGWTRVINATYPRAQAVEVHEHREATKADFEGKTIARFEPDADNVWRFWFTDGSAFAIQCESSPEGIGYMELCDVCLGEC